MTVLRDDIAAFERMRSELEAKHFRKWAVFHAGQLHDIYSEFGEAAAAAEESFGDDPCLIRQVGAPAAIQLPGGMIFTPAHALNTSGI